MLQLDAGLECPAELQEFQAGLLAYRGEMLARLDAKLVYRGGLGENDNCLERQRRELHGGRTGIGRIQPY